MSSPKVNLDPETPSEKIISAPVPTTLCREVTDADGKVYVLRLPDPLDEFDLSAALGKESTNLGMLAQATPLIYIESIDGAPFKRPNSLGEIRASLKIIGRNGMRSVSSAVWKFTAEEQANAEVMLTEIKK